MRQIMISGLEVFISALGLKWPVSYFLRPGETTCRITCDSMTKTHEIWVHTDVVRNPRQYLCDLVHELCHGALAERVSVAFSTAYFSKKYTGLAGQAREALDRRALQLYAAWAPVCDIWVNDLRHSYWPELSREDARSFAEGVFGIVAAGQTEIVARQEFVLALALNLAELGRHDLPPTDFGSVLAVLSKQTGKKIRRLAELLQRLPRLSLNNRASDCQRLQLATQQTAQLLGLSFIPRLVEEDGRHVWLV